VVPLHSATQMQVRYISAGERPQQALVLERPLATGDIRSQHFRVAGEGRAMAAAGGRHWQMYD